MSGVLAAKVSMIGPAPAGRSVHIQIKQVGQTIERRQFDDIAQLTVGPVEQCQKLAAGQFHGVVRGSQQAHHRGPLRC